MAGLCGVIGDEPTLGDVAAGLEWTGEESVSRFADDELQITGVVTERDDAAQPVPVGEDSLLWIWGSVFGFEGTEGYRPRDRSAKSTAVYCADRYEQHGIEFVAGLNGDFVGVLYDRTERTVSIFTDRLGLRDTYYTTPTDGTLLFSTAIQSLSRHPAVQPAFDDEFVAEYLTCGFRTFGVATPLANTSLFPPGSVITIDPETADVAVQSYWDPRYRPQDRPFSYFLDQFTDLFERVVNERLSADRRYGLLLSGGADSRLVLAAMDKSARERLTTYHMSGWMNREARTAQAVARTAGVDFEYLERHPDYHARALTRNPALSNFVGTFEQAHAEGFMPQIRRNVDEVITANFADSNFKGYSFPQYSLNLGPLGSLPLPVFEPMDSIERYIDFWATDPPAYVNSSVDVDALLRRAIRATDDGIDHHGITYGSPQELFVCGALTPRTNGSVLFLLQSLQQHRPAWSPFVDNRLVDLYLSMPTRHFVRRNIIHRATERLDPSLAEIPYPATGLPIDVPFAAHYLGEHFQKFRDKFVPAEEPPAPHLGHSSLPDLPSLVSERSFVCEALERHRQAIEALPFLDWEGAMACYRRHMDGESRHTELYGLLTLLEMPVTKRIVDQIAEEGPTEVTTDETESS